MGTTDYYSVTTILDGVIIYLDGKGFEDLVQELCIYKIDVVPQFKSSESDGWSVYLCTKTGTNPGAWQKFQAMNTMIMKSSGVVGVIYQQNGPIVLIPARPGQGVQITKTIGPVQPK